MQFDDEIWIIGNDLSFLWNLSMYKQQQITQKLDKKALDFCSAYESFAVHTLIKSTKMNFP